MSSLRFPLRTLLLTVSIAVMACGSDQVTNPGTSDLSAPVALNGGAILSPPVVAQCERQPYAVTTMVIGPAGGKLKAGKNEFDIPRGALSTNVRITMESVYDGARSVRFAPEGLAFNPRYLPKLKLDYKGCRIPHGASKKVVYVTEALRILEVLPSAEDPLNASVRAHLKHFSRYAVAW